MFLKTKKNTNNESYHRCCNRSSSINKFTTAIWSGGNTDWQDLIGYVEYIYVASALPQEMTPDINIQYGGAFKHISATPDLYFKPSIIGSQNVLLSIGGSAASIQGWKDMAIKYTIDDWISYFTILYSKYGINGIDWDIEPDSLYQDNSDNTIICTFIGELSKKLKSKISVYKISVTVFGNVQKYVKNKSVALMLENYIDYFDVIPIMLYNGGMWRANTWGSWCDYAKSFFQFVSEKVGKKILYAVWIASQSKDNADCCASCINQIIQYVQNKQGLGMALWCYGGYLGACSNFKEINLKVLQSIKSNKNSHDITIPTLKQLQEIFENTYPYKENPSWCLSDGCGTIKT